MDRRGFLKNSAAVITAFLAGKGLTFASEKEGDEYHDEYRHNKRAKERINRLTNKDNPSVLEQKHVPAIDLPSEVRKGEFFDVKVRVGFMKEHPSTPEHWITKIKLLVDGQEVAEEKHYIGGVSPSEATFRIKLDRSATIEAIEHCNLHGTWISEPIEVRVR